MKCALVIPPWNHGDTHPHALVGTVAGLWPPTGLLYIAAVLRQDGHDVQVLDGAFMTTGEILAGLTGQNPSLIGISSVFPLWSKAKALALEIKARLPHGFLAVGGQGPTYLNGTCLQECPAMDAVVLGEGELIFRQLARALEDHQPVTAIPGTIVRKDGESHENSGYGLVQDLDALPFPAYDCIDIRRYRPSIGLFKRLPIVSTFSSRGCSNHCIYCSKIAGQTVRWKSPARVGEELEYYVKHLGVKEVKFFDDLFTFDRERALQICQEIGRRTPGLIWSASSRVDTMDRHLLLQMKKAGCWYIHYGVESGVQKNLDTLKKGTTLQQIRDTIALTHSAGIHTFTSYIIGIPGETVDDARQTIHLACELNSLYAEFFCCTPFPGTPLYQHIQDYGVITGNGSQLGMHLDAFHPYTMTPQTINRLRNQAFVRFYLRPATIFKHLKTIRNSQDLRYKLQGLSALSVFLLSSISNSISNFIRRT